MLLLFHEFSISEILERSTNCTEDFSACAVYKAYDKPSLVRNLNL